MALTADESWLAFVFAAAVPASLGPKDLVEAKAVPLEGGAALCSAGLMSEEALAVAVQACHWCWTDL